MTVPAVVTFHYTNKSMCVCVGGGERRISFKRRNNTTGKDHAT